MIKRNFTKVNRNRAPVKFIQLNGKTAKILKKKLYMESGGCCPILRKSIKVRDSVLDHTHKLKSQRPGPLGRGLVRGAIHFQVNSFEGVILKKYKRYGLTEMMPLPDLLRSIADYLEDPPCPQRYIYPTEGEKAPFFKISEYKRIVKYYFIMFPRRKKIPQYPPSKIKIVGKNKKKKYVARITPKWQKLLDMANKINERSKKEKI